MKRIQASTLSVFIVIALLCPAAFADGDMGSGGLADYDLPGTTVKTVRTTEDGDMGSGGRLAANTEKGTSLESLLNSIFDYFDSMI